MTSICMGAGIQPQVSGLTQQALYPGAVPTAHLLLLEDQELVVLHDALAVVSDLLEDGLVGLALEDDVLLNQGLRAAPHCNAVGPEGVDPVLQDLGEAARAVTETHRLLDAGQVSDCHKTRESKRAGEVSTEQEELWVGRRGQPAGATGVLELMDRLWGLSWGQFFP